MKIRERAKPKVPPVDEGVYMGICVGIIDLGEQYSEVFKSYSNKVKIVWELIGETVEIDGEQKPRQLSKDFAFSTSNKSKLRSFIQSWRTKTYSDDEFADIDLFDLLGEACQLSVVHNESHEYANVDSVMAIPKGFPVPTTDTELIKWDMQAWDDELFEKLPDWYKEQIKKSTEYQKIHAPTEEIKVEPPSEEACPI